mmetsp:Transcript_20169/g.46254  ORF Transcript_20169/g.46254 Transcript_20169/m.46254 type:complete len:995 (-) Transcript_20169:24-3008(-)
MPAFKILGNLNTSPLAGDDFQLICIILGFYRTIQLVCLVPLIVNDIVRLYNGSDLYVEVDGETYGPWCPQYDEFNKLHGSFIVISEDQFEKYSLSRNSFSRLFIISAGVFMAIDIGWILCLWNFASIGTPTNPGPRNVFLRRMIFLRWTFINLFPIVLLVLGCLKVYQLRRDNYGCGEDEVLVSSPPDSSVQYGLFCALLVTYALEIFIWPAVFVSHVVYVLRRNKFTQRNRYATREKGKRLEMCLGVVFKCVSVLFPNQGGKELKNDGEMRDFASNLMEFANNDTQLGLTLSDMYVGGKLLARVQAERRVKAIQELQQTSNLSNEGKSLTESEGDGASDNGGNRRAQLMNEGKQRRRQSILTLQTEDGQNYVVMAKQLLQSQNREDAEILSLASHYAIYAQYVYFHMYAVLEEYLPDKAQSFIRDFTLGERLDEYSLAMFDMPYAHLYCASFENGITQTPYSILVDEMQRSIVITIRGTNSLEDWVIDLQYVPLPLEQIGASCGFDGTNHHCHKGVLTRAKWLYNDIRKKEVLKKIYSQDSEYKDFDLVVVGHSLGGGCAQVLSLMLRPSFPSLRCFAFEPPGCIFDENLAEDCKEWIISIVRHDDLVPRITQPNLESLRDEFLDVIARIKVPKYKAFHDVRAPCPESHLKKRNEKMLCPKKEIDRDTDFYAIVQAFRNERALKNQTGAVATKLYIPGRIIHLVDTAGAGAETGIYVPYWASKYEFNQVILSSRMLPDHAMPPLVEILNSLNLDEEHEVKTWHTEEAVEEEIEVRRIVPFSNPHGRLPMTLTAVSLGAFIMSIACAQGCSFVSRTTMIQDANGELYPGLGLDAGIWSYAVMKCKKGVSCESNITNIIELNVDDFEDSHYCQPYSDVFVIDGHWKLARIAGPFASLVGLVGLAFCGVATCTKLGKRSWTNMSVLLFLVACVLQGMQLSYLRSDMCTDWDFSSDMTAMAACKLSTEGILAVVACILWFVSSVTSLVMSRQVKHSS